jgi:hypothetical protein
MSFYRHLAILLCSSAAATLLVVVVVSLLNIGPMPRAQQSVAPFSRAELTLAKRETVVTTGLKNAFAGSTPAHNNYPQVALSEIVGKGEVKEDDCDVRMVLIQEGRKIALIDGRIVKEGDVVNKQKVMRIEKDRVLLKNGSNREKWIPLAQEKSNETRNVGTRGRPENETGLRSSEIENRRG